MSPTHKLANVAVRSPDELVAPRVYEGAEYTQELVDAKSGHAKRYRNIAASPLSLAFYKGHLDGPGDVISKINGKDRFDSGERFERLWYLKHATHRVAIMEKIGGGDGHGFWWNDTKQDALSKLLRLEQQMYGKNFEIVRRFCGEGYTAAQTIRHVTQDASRHIVWPRLREAMDDLVVVMTGKR